MSPAGQPVAVRWILFVHAQIVALVVEVRGFQAARQVYADARERDPLARCTFASMHLWDGGVPAYK